VVTYVHLMFDAHQIIIAEGGPSESFYPGPMAQKMVDPGALTELRMLFPDIVSPGIDMARVQGNFDATVRGFAPKKSV